jgi:hypothetical protein
LNGDIDLAAFQAATTQANIQQEIEGSQLPGTLIPDSQLQAQPPLHPGLGTKLALGLGIGLGLPISALLMCLVVALTKRRRSRAVRPGAAAGLSRPSMEQAWVQQAPPSPQHQAHHPEGALVASYPAAM